MSFMSVARGRDEHWGTYLKTDQTSSDSARPSFKRDANGNFFPSFLVAEVRFVEGGCCLGAWEEERRRSGGRPSRGSGASLDIRDTRRAPVTSLVAMFARDGKEMQD